MISRDLVIDATDKQVSIALMEDNQLVELHHDQRDETFSVGDIYLGKVKKLMPGLNAAFVNVGHERDAFLHYLDLGPQLRSLLKYYAMAISRKGKVPPLHRFHLEPDIDKNGKIKDVLKVGMTIPVQITKEPISTKGPRLGSEISLAGRNLVLLPFSDKVSISQKIESAEEKARLKMLIQSIKPRNYGVIIRTVAEGKKVAVLDTELRDLVAKFEGAFAQIRKDVKSPKLFVSEVSRTTATLRDLLNVSFSNIHTNSEQQLQEIKSYIREIAPEKEKIVRLYKGGLPIFDHFGLHKQIKSLFGKTVSFKKGSYLIIEHTEALHVIDVNSGNRSKSDKDQETNALDVNLAAAHEIARQLRLRDMGGIIVVDFIDMQSQEHKHQLLETMKEAMKDDRTKHNILPLSRFGLMQITRQRVRPEMNIKTEEKCPTCNGSGNITPTVLFTDDLEKKIADVVGKVKTRKLILRVHPFIEAYLNKGTYSFARKWSLKYKIILRVKAIPSYTFLEYHLFDRFGDEVDLSD